MTLVLNGRKLGWSVWISFSSLIFVALLWNIPSLGYVPDHDKCERFYGLNAEILRDPYLQILCEDREDAKLEFSINTHYGLILFNSVNVLAWFLVGNNMHKWVAVK